MFRLPRLQRADHGRDERPTGRQHDGAGAVAEDGQRVAVARVEDAWGEIFSAAGQSYPPPTLVLYRDAVQSACADTVRSALVLLDLLERQVQRLAKLRLAEAEDQATLPQARADMDINSRRLATGLARFPAGYRFGHGGDPSNQSALVGGDDS